MNRFYEWLLSFKGVHACPEAQAFLLVCETDNSSLVWAAQGQQHWTNERTYTCHSMQLQMLICFLKINSLRFCLSIWNTQIYKFTSFGDALTLELSAPLSRTSNCTNARLQTTDTRAWLRFLLKMTWLRLFETPVIIFGFWEITNNK